MSAIREVPDWGRLYGAEGTPSYVTPDVTTETAAPATETGETFTIRKDELGTLLARVLPYVAKAGDLAALTAVRLEVRPGEIVAVTTDRYRLAVAVYRATRDDDSVSGAWSVTLHADDVVRLAKAYKPSRGSQYEPVTASKVGDRVTFADWSSTVTLTEATNEFPRWRSLVAGIIGREPGLNAAGTFGCNMDFLATFAKSAQRGQRAVWHFLGEDKPAAVTLGDDFLGILMPVRKQGGDAQTSELAPWLSLIG